MANLGHLPFSMRQEGFYIEPSAENQLFCGRALYNAFTSKRARAFNGRKIRLCVDFNRSTLDNAPIALQPSNYYSEIATNEAANLILHCKVGHRVIRGDVFCTADGKMRTLVASQCASELGGNSLAFTSDGHLGLHIQTEANLVGKGLSPSCAGSLDLEDAEGTKGLEELIVNGTVRELREESLVYKNEQTTQLMGFAICAHRGYKPDFFAVTKLQLTLAELRDRHRAGDATIEEFVGPLYFAEVGTVAVDAKSSIEKLLASRFIKVTETNGEGTAEIPFGNVLTLALTILNMHLDYRRDSVISKFLFDN